MTVVMVGVCVCLNSNISSECTIGWFVICDCVLMILISIPFLFGLVFFYFLFIISESVLSLLRGTVAVVTLGVCVCLNYIISLIRCHGLVSYL